MGENTTPVAELCQRYGLTTWTLAERFGIPVLTVMDWHAGRVEAPSYVVNMMSQLLTLERVIRRKGGIYAR